MFVYIPKWEIGYDSCSALLRYAMIKSNTAEFLKIQEHNRKILKRILKRNKLGLIKKDFLICEMSVLLISRFYKWG